MANYTSIYTGSQIDEGVGKGMSAYQKPSGGIPDSDLEIVGVGKGGTGANNATTARANLGLGNVDNTADANKSVNYANSAGSATYSTYASSSSNTGMVLRNQGLVASDTTPSNNGEIYWTYA